MIPSSQPISFNTVLATDETGIVQYLVSLIVILYELVSILIIYYSYKACTKAVMITHYNDLTVLATILHC